MGQRACLLEETSRQRLWLQRRERFKTASTRWSFHVTETEKRERLGGAKALGDRMAHNCGGSARVSIGMEGERGSGEALRRIMTVRMKGLLRGQLRRELPLGGPSADPRTQMGTSPFESRQKRSNRGVPISDGSFAKSSCPSKRFSSFPSLPAVCSSAPHLRSWGWQPPPQSGALGGRTGSNSLNPLSGDDRRSRP